MEHLKIDKWISSLFGKLLAMQSNRILCDAVIECGDDEKLPVHSCVLAAASPVFQQALASHGTELISQQKILAGQEFSKHIWTLLIKFVYTGQIEHSLASSEVDLLKNIASKLSIYELEEMIDRMKANNLPKDEVIKDEYEEINTNEDVIHEQENVEQDEDDTVCNEEKHATRQERNVKCKHCSESFGTSAILLQHCKDIHWKYKCAHCDKGFEKKTSLSRHESMVHINVNEEYACKHCEFRTKSSAMYFVHLKKHKQYKCTACPYQGKTKSSLLSHLKEAHHQQNQKLYRCSFSWCTYSTNKEGSVKAHEKSVHATDRSFKCPSCSKCYKTQADLNRHASVHNHEYMCDECDASFARKFSLEDHKRKMHNAEPLTCPECAILFTSIPLRNKHIREVHQGRITKSKRCPCKLCGKVVSGMGELRRHMRLHTGEKLYPCNSCSRSFATKNDLLNHQMIHTGEKPFLCAYCPFKCNRQYNLRVHERKHLEEKVVVKCSLCNPEVSFRCLDDLDKHKLKEHPEMSNVDVGEVNHSQEQNQNVILNGEYEIMVLDNEEDPQNGKEVFIPIEQLEGRLSDLNTNSGILLAHNNVLNERTDQPERNLVSLSDPNQLFQIKEYIEGFTPVQGSETQNILTFIQGDARNTGEQIVITNEQVPYDQMHMNEQLLQAVGTEEQEEIMYTGALADIQEGTVVFLPQQ